MASGIYWATAFLCVLLILLALDIMGLLSFKNHFDVEGRTVLLTGGSQGMGRGLGKLLAQKGANIVIVARNKQKLDEALNYISSAAKAPQTQRFHAISADMTKPEENSRLLKEVTGWNGGHPPDIVWANAGSSHPELFIDTPVDILRSQMDINYWAAAYLAQESLKAWLKPVAGNARGSNTKEAKPRHFIMTSSVLCFAGIAGYSPYSPAKSAMRSLADTLRSEVNLYNGARRKDLANGPPADVKIHCVCPGTILSPGHDNEQKTKHEVTKILEKGDPAQNEDEVAAAAVKGLEKGGYLITTQLFGHAMRAGSLGGSPRNNIFLDTVFSWLTSVLWLFIGPDLEGKVYSYGKKHGAKLPS